MRYKKVYLYQVWYPGASEKNKASVKERKDLGLSGLSEEFVPHTVEALTDIEKWNDKTIQTGLKYLLGPGGRAYGSQETYIRNGKEWNPASWSNRRYYHYDRLGSVTAISLDKPGVAGEYYEYGPFGEILKGTHKWLWEHNGNYHMGFDSIGYTGTRIDAESGNYHFPFREYDPLTSQWTTSDPIKDGDLWYGYVNSNPVKYIDPLGLEAHLCYTVKSGDSYLNIARHLMDSTGRKWLQGLVKSSKNKNASNHIDAYRIVNEVAEAIKQSRGGAMLQPGQEIELSDIGEYVPRFALNKKRTSNTPTQTRVNSAEQIDNKIKIVQNPLTNPIVYGDRQNRKASEIKAIVVHQTYTTTASAAINSFNAGGGSTQYLIDKDGTILQLLPDSYSGYHILKGREKSWVTNLNSIGIEFVGTAYEDKVNGIRSDDYLVYEDLTEEQQQSGLYLMKYLMKKYNITSSKIFKHPVLQAKNATEAESVQIPQ